MAKLSKETKQRLQQVFQCGQFVIRWGFIPTVLYLGFKRGADPGMPEPTVLSLLWGWDGFGRDQSSSLNVVLPANRSHYGNGHNFIATNCNIKRRPVLLSTYQCYPSFCGHEECMCVYMSSIFILHMSLIWMWCPVYCHPIWTSRFTIDLPGAVEELKFWTYILSLIDLQV